MRPPSRCCNYFLPDNCQGGCKHYYPADLTDTSTTTTVPFCRALRKAFSTSGKQRRCPCGAPETGKLNACNASQYGRAREPGKARRARKLGGRVDLAVQVDARLLPRLLVLHAQGAAPPEAGREPRPYLGHQARGVHRVANVHLLVRHLEAASRWLSLAIGA